MPVLTKQYEVTRIGISKDDDIKVNFALEVPKLPCRYDVVLHAAGKAHIYPKTEEEKKSFYDVNVTGTKNLCSALNIYGLPKTLILYLNFGRLWK